eukprot:CAMPEP_0177598328 /NCGR_PEP_ID=MMETSP0419_2-20121207/12277_1 /TAXON_ID=582737 /ORGANISM="Tetraselmis sp., Strain GSL018" /LENGTH=218 /DNA_ID=CAMNT_0019090739 /DNA_START=60 /DNA_END=716 /DNA_ORIENTATION=+
MFAVRPPGKHGSPSPPREPPPPPPLAPDTPETEPVIVIVAVVVFLDFDSEQSDARTQIKAIIAIVFRVPESTVDITSFIPGSINVGFSIELPKTEVTESEYGDIDREKAQALFQDQGFNVSVREAGSTVRGEESKSSSTSIVIISASAGGGVLFLCLFSVAVFVILRRRSRLARVWAHESENSEDESFGPDDVESMEDIASDSESPRSDSFSSLDTAN